MLFVYFSTVETIAIAPEVNDRRRIPPGDQIGLSLAPISSASPLRDSRYRLRRLTLEA